MRIAVLFFTLISTLFAISDNYKIVIASYKTNAQVQQIYANEISNPKMPLFIYTHEKNRIFHTRKSGNNYILTIEPFSNRNDAQTILDSILPIYPDAFISRGVANDIDFSVMKHRKSLIEEESTTKNIPQITAIPSKEISISPSTPKEITILHSSPQYEKWLFISIILALLIYIGWRERVLKILKNRIQLLSKENKEIQNSMHAKNEFIAMMNHEIRAPINAVMGITHLLLESDLTLSQRSQLTKIKEASAILLTLVNDILDHSKMEAGKITIEKIPFDLNTMLDNISNIVAHKATEKHLELIFDIDQGVPNKLIGDPLRLLQIIVNLLNNAIKFTDNGSVILRLRADNITPINIKIHFEIIDTGIGIKPESLKDLFTSYNQVDETISRKYGGTGLGLSICKNLVSLMGGNIYVSSTPNRGSTFSFDINLYSDSVYEKRRYRLPTTELMSKNGLILDDNLVSAEVLKRGLEYFHYEIKIVTNSIDALPVLKNDFIDIVFIDTRIILSGEFKKELQNRIKNKNFKLVWIGDDAKKREGVILTKPYNQLRIFNAILLLYDHLDQKGHVQNNGKKLKESLKRFAGETLLLAEDNEINCSIIKGLLADTGIIIITVSNGKEAIDTVELNSEITVVLMDIQMPIMDGFEAAKYIRNDPSKDFISIVAVTGNTFEDDIHKISTSGMNGYIGKPLDVNIFYTTLYNAFEESQMKYNKKS
jgi:signal transduction histidine kinase/CheY-like chemotaxis protein